MSNLVLAVAATGLSAVVMYLVCLRPMRRHAAQRVQIVDPARPELAQLRRDVASLRAQTHHRDGGERP